MAYQLPDIAPNILALARAMAPSLSLSLIALATIFSARRAALARGRLFLVHTYRLLLLPRDIYKL